jgi:cyclophilin family peptidyl-prolyl cis-trans isomerase
MARGPLGASSSQFFITLTPQGSLDQQGFTAFGRVVLGFEAVQQSIMLRDPNSAPTPGTRMVSVTIRQDGGEGAASESADETADGVEDEDLPADLGEVDAAEASEGTSAASDDAPAGG